KYNSPQKSSFEDFAWIGSQIIKRLKGAFKKETQPLLLSVSALGPVDHSAVTDERTLSQYVDFISILPPQLKKDGPYMTTPRSHDFNITPPLSFRQLF
ncbi:hypothetical protein cypCar_00024610, partial [Cyprinus carpio]